MNRVLFIMPLLALALQACSNEPTTALRIDPQELSTASVLTLKAVNIDVRYVTSGTVTSDHRVSISSRISGYIRTLSVREGDRVKQEQVLVRVDPVNAKQALVQAEADLADARADMNRYEALFRAHAASQQQLDRVRLRYKVVRSQVAQARNQLGFADVLSPVDGVVVEKRLSKGDLAQPGAAILIIEDPSNLLVNTYVSEQFVSGIHAGDAVDVEIPSMQRHIAGTVRQVVVAADAVSHQFLIKVELEPELASKVTSDGAVHPGMYAQVGFAIGTRQALLVPAAAVVERAGLHGIYVVDDKAIAHYRQVRLGHEGRGATRGGQGGDQFGDQWGGRRGDQHGGQKIEILAGLHAGDRIAWHGNPVLRTGMKVQEK